MPNHNHQNKKTILVTGFYSGIGKQITTTLAGMNMHIIGIGRTEMKARQATDEIKNETGNNNIDIVQCDLAETDEVKEAVKKIKSKYPTIDALINNAGIINSQLLLNKHGLENTFAVSAMASFLLTQLLYDNLSKSPSPLVVNIISEAYKNGEVDVEQYTGKKKYKTMSSYANAKLAEVLWTCAMANEPKSKNMVFRLVHPGMVPNTGGFRRMPWWVKPVIKILQFTPVVSTREQAAAPVIESVNKQEQKQEQVKLMYLKEGSPAELADKARDIKNQQTVWKFLHDVTGLRVEKK